MPSNTVAIFGSHGGIGNAFVKHYLDNEMTAKCYSFSRTSSDLSHPRLSPSVVDVTSEDSIQQALSRLDIQNLNRVIVTLGTLHSDQRMPEKQLSDISLPNLEEVFRINAFAPALILKAIKPFLNRREQNVIAILSARVGSISDNQLGGWYAYRASKAALNMIIKSAAIEFGRTHKQTTIIGLHPGKVDTNLSKPFQQRLKAGQLFTPDQSVSYMAQVIESLTPDQSGQCLAYDGSLIEP